MGLNLSNVYQRPYVTQNTRNLVKKKQDDENSRSTSHAEREDGNIQQGKSRGLQYVDNRSDEFTRNTAPVDAQPWQKEIYRNAQTYHATPTSVAVNQKQPTNISINIAQILKDFKNTSVAIGTPDDLKEEVNGYLDLIEKQVLKDEPNVRLIKSNLKNASTILDNYISETLNKDSKVVENWVDALFMQDVDFKYNENDVNPQYLVKFPEGSTNQEEIEAQAPIESETVKSEEVTSVPEEVVQSESKVKSETRVYIPQDSELKSLFLQSKKLAYAKEPKKAIENFQKALNRADEVGDTETKSKIFFEIGKIYDDYDFPAQALKSYHQSIQHTTDNNVKTRAHFSMAQIYDDVNQIEPALDHYFVSVGYGGEIDNPALQSTSLAKMGNIYSDMYEEDAFEYLTTAKDLVENTDNSKVKGYVFSSLGRAYERFGEPQEALKSYSDAVKNYTDADSPLKAAQNYLRAAEIMLEFNSNNKARGLLNKAQKFAAEVQDESLLKDINDKLNRLAA